MPKDALHHSRLLEYRTPQGALKTGQTVRLRLFAGLRFQSASATLRLWVQGRERRVPMRRLPVQEGVRFEAEAQMPGEPGLVWYYFLLEQLDGEVLCYGGESGEGELYPHEPPGYQITVYDPAFTTPRSFREGILYQIFPDRFRRGADVKRAEENPGVAYHRSLGRRVRVHNDWAAQPNYLPEEGQEKYAPNDFFCGDLLGIRQALPYLKSLGVTCIYLNPVFESASNHRYDTADYRRVDPILGGDEALRALCEAAKGQGMRIMLDGVFSHTGADSVYFNKYGRYPAAGAYQSEGSPYRSWYDFGEEHENGYRSWWGFPELPEVNETDPGYLDFVMDGPDSLLTRWAEVGVTSWRLDVADELPDAFIARLRTRLKSIDPDGVLLGEVWEDASNKVAYGAMRQYVEGNTLDSAMNYPFRAAVAAYLLHKTDAYALNHRLQTLRERYPKPFYYAAMNLLSTHDTVRILTVLGGAPDRDALTREAQAAFSLTPDALALARARLVLAAAMQMAVPGVPSIYYGDEAGLTGMADPFNRGTYPWGNEDGMLLSAYHTLTRVRRGNAALRAGYCRMGALSPDVFVVLRYTAEGFDAFFEPSLPAAALLLCNRSAEPQSVRLSAEDLPEGPDFAVPVSLSGVWRDALSGRALLCESGSMEAALPALTAMLLLRE